jgi:hypothetical protein
MRAGLSPLLRPSPVLMSYTQTTLFSANSNTSMRIDPRAP